MLTKMDKEKRKRLEAAGWKFGTAADFLQLTPEEEALVELKVKLSNALQERRKKLGITQNQLAMKLRSSQSRVAKMEADDPTVSIDLLIRGLLSTGVGLEGLSRIVYPRARKTAKAR
jgi:ribosome-binding protein aMBF1 (putative translation factor)